MYCPLLYIYIYIYIYAFVNFPYKLNCLAFCCYFFSKMNNHMHISLVNLGDNFGPIFFLFKFCVLFSKILRTMTMN